MSWQYSALSQTFLPPPSAFLTIIIILNYYVVYIDMSNWQSAAPGYKLNWTASDGHEKHQAGIRHSWLAPELFHFGQVT